MSAASISQKIIQRYSQALFDLALAQNAIEAIERDSENLQQCLAESQDLMHFCKDKLLSSMQQNAIIEGISKTLKLHQLTQNFLKVLVSNRRLSTLPLCIEAIREIIRAYKGEKHIVVEVAQALSAEKEKTLSKELTRIFQSKLNIEWIVNPKILAGLKVYNNSLMIDASLERQLSEVAVAAKHIIMMD